MSRIVVYDRYPFGDDPGVAPLISGEGARAYYRMGFLYCAQDALNALLNRTGSNTSAMPVLFLCRHYVELALKDVLTAAGAFAIELSDRTFGHELNDLWTEVSKVLESFGRRDVSVIETAVAELVELDRRADAFRYATNGKNQPHFERIGAVDLNALTKTLEVVSALLEELLDEMERDEAEMDAEIARAVERDRT